MPPKAKETTKKPPAVVARPTISDSSLLNVPTDAVDGYQERLHTGVEWTLIEKASLHHRAVCQRNDIPRLTFSEALRSKLEKSILNGFLNNDSNMSLQDYWDLILPTTLWDNDKFGSEEAKICFRKINRVTDNIINLIKETCKVGDRDFLRRALKKATVLRLNDTEMTDLDEELLEYKHLVNLNLCGNFIEQFNGKFLPDTLKTLELHANRVRNLNSIAEYLPNNLIYLGLSRNLLDDANVDSLNLLPYHLTVLDISHNDIYDINLVLNALAKLPNLISLALTGNPCSVCAGYARTTLLMLPRLRWLDYREVLPTDRPLEPVNINPDDLRSAYFYFTVFRVMSAPQPPKTEKGALMFFHVELELPLLDSQRRAFLMFRNNDSLVEMLPPPEDDSVHSMQKSSHQRMSTIANFALDEQSPHASDIYKNPIAKSSREVIHYRTFESNKVQWNKIMNFQEPAVKIFCPDLVALRDTFRSILTIRLVYTLTMPSKPTKEKDKDKKGTTLGKAATEQRVVLAEVKCALRKPDWSQPSQHFHWDECLDTNDAIHWGDGDLSAVHYSQVIGVKPSRPVQESKNTAPDSLTIHVGFEVETSSAFIIPYILTLVICGIPLVYLETSLGQFGSVGCISVFNINPLFRGVGYAVIVLNVIAVLYFASLIAYPVLYMYHSLSSPLPWQHCGNPWNTDKCVEITGNATIFITGNNSITTPEDEFFHRHLLRLSPGINEIGGIVWPVFWCNVICWVIVYLCICKGVQSVGKIVYFTVIFPYVVLCVLFVRGVTLPGAWQGILYYILPDWQQLAKPKVWAEAATQIFYSLGPGWGGLVSMASFNRFNYNNLPSSIIIPLINSGTSIWAGFVVFSVLGFAAERAGVPVAEVATAGPGLAYVTYPAAVTLMPAPNMWAITFFVMLFFLGIDTMFVTVEAIIAGVLDEYPKLRKRRPLVTLVTCLALFSLSIICNTEGGMHVTQLLDYHVAIACVPAVCLMEIIAAVYTYGPKQLAFDIQFMTGQRLNPCWLVLWKYVLPVILTVVAIFSLREVNSVYGWCVALVSVVIIPIYMIVYLLQMRGPFTHRVWEACQPSEHWGPADPLIRNLWITAQRTQTLTATQLETFQ